MVDVTGLGQTDDGVNEDIGLAGTGSTDSEFPVCAMHGIPGSLLEVFRTVGLGTGIPGLESDDLGPAELLKVETEFRGCVWHDGVNHSVLEIWGIANKYLHLRPT